MCTLSRTMISGCCKCIIFTFELNYTRYILAAHIFFYFDVNGVFHGIGIGTLQRMDIDVFNAYEYLVLYKEW